MNVSGSTECFGAVEENKQHVRSRHSKRKVKHSYQHSYSDCGREQKTTHTLNWSTALSLRTHSFPSTKTVRYGRMTNGAKAGGRQLL